MKKYRKEINIYLTLIFVFGFVRCLIFLLQPVAVSDGNVNSSSQQVFITSLIAVVVQATLIFCLYIAVKWVITFYFSKRNSSQTT